MITFNQFREAFVVDPSGIGKSLAQAATSDHERKMKRAAVLDKQPDGTIAIAHKREYTKITLDKGEVFWTSKKNTLTSFDLATEIGTGLAKFGWVEEAYNPSTMNWNIQPSVRVNTRQPVPGRPPEGLVTYHKDIGLPKDFERPTPGMALRYANHAKDRSEEKSVPLPTRLPTNFVIIEVQMEKYRVEKWVIRFPTETEYDVVMVVQPDGFVRTTWPNHHEDLHRTLDKSKYAGKPNF